MEGGDYLAASLGGFAEYAGVTFLGQHRSSALVSSVGEGVSCVDQALNPALFSLDNDARGSARGLGSRRERLKYDQLWFHAALP